MQISLVSSLTPDDEQRCASAFFKAICSLLDLLPVTYSVRITTTSGKSLARTHSPANRVESSMPQGKIASEIGPSESDPPLL